MTSKVDGQGSINPSVVNLQANNTRKFKDFFRDTFTFVEKSLTQIGTLSKLSNVASKIIKLVQVIFGDDSFPTLNLVKIPIKAISNITSSLKLVEKGKEFICPEDSKDPKKCKPFWLNTSTSVLTICQKVSALVGSILKTIKFLGTLGILNLAKAAQAIGKIPVLGVIAKLPFSVAIHAVQIISKVLGSVADIKSLISIEKDLKKKSKSSTKWNRRSRDLETILDFLKKKVALEQLQGDTPLPQGPSCQENLVSTSQPILNPVVVQEEQPGISECSEGNIKGLESALQNSIAHESVNESEVPQRQNSFEFCAREDRRSLSESLPIFENPDHSTNAVVNSQPPIILAPMMLPDNYGYMPTDDFPKKDLNPKESPKEKGTKQSSIAEVSDFETEFKSSALKNEMEIESLFTDKKNDVLTQKEVQDLHDKIQGITLLQKPINIVDSKTDIILTPIQQKSEVVSSQTVLEEPPKPLNVEMDQKPKESKDLPSKPIEVNPQEKLPSEEKKELNLNPPLSPQNPVPAPNPVENDAVVRPLLLRQIEEIKKIDTSIARVQNLVAKKRAGLMSHYSSKIKSATAEIFALHKNKEKQKNVESLHVKVIKWNNILKALQENQTDALQDIKTEFDQKVQLRNQTMQILKQTKLQRIFSLIYRIARIALSIITIALLCSGVGTVAGFVTTIVGEILLASFGTFKFFWKQSHPVT